MHVQELREWLRREPFRPFRFYVLEMTAFEVRHPETVIIGTVSLDVFVPSANLPGGQTHHRETISLIHITRLEPLFVPPSPYKTNGEQQ
jgi:hypothetical protein